MNKKFTKKLKTEALNLFGIKTLSIDHPLAEKFIYSRKCSFPQWDNVYLAKVKDVCSESFIKEFDEKLYKMASRKFESYPFMDLPPFVTWFENIKGINKDTSVGDMYVELRIQLAPVGAYHENLRDYSANIGLSSLPVSYVLGSYNICYSSPFTTVEINEIADGFKKSLAEHLSIEDFERATLKRLDCNVEEAEKNTDSEGYYKTSRYTAYNPERILEKFGTIFTTRGYATCFGSLEFDENYNKAEALYPTYHYKYNGETYKKTARFEPTGFNATGLNWCCRKVLSEKGS